MQSRITGTTMPVLEFILENNESIISEAGELSWMGPSIQMTTHTQFAGGGVLFGVIKRVAGGGSIFMTEYRAMGGPGELAFATKLPGHIVPIELAPGHEFMIHRHGFPLRYATDPGWRRFSTVAWRRDFRRRWIPVATSQRTGHRMDRTFGRISAARPAAWRETLRVHPGHVGAFQSSVSFQITTVPGIKNMIFGGDGIFLASLTGPGRIWLQTLPISKLAHAIQRYLPREVQRQTVRGRSSRRNRWLDPRQHAIEVFSVCLCDPCGQWV